MPINNVGSVNPFTQTQFKGNAQVSNPVNAKPQEVKDGNSKLKKALIGLGIAGVATLGILVAAKSGKLNRVSLKEVKFDKGIATLKGVDGKKLTGTITDTLKNGSKVKMCYIDGVLQSSKVVKQDGTKLAKNFIYNTKGKLSKVINNGKATIFKYDKAGKLVRLKEKGLFKKRLNAHFSYDEAGKLTEMKKNGVIKRIIPSNAVPGGKPQVKEVLVAEVSDLKPEDIRHLRNCNADLANNGNVIYQQPQALLPEGVKTNNVASATANATQTAGKAKAPNERYQAYMEKCKEVSANRDAIRQQAKEKAATKTIQEGAQQRAETIRENYNKGLDEIFERADKAKKGLIDKYTAQKQQATEELAKIKRDFKNGQPKNKQARKALEEANKRFYEADDALYRLRNEASKAPTQEVSTTANSLTKIRHSAHGDRGRNIRKAQEQMAKSKNI